MSHKPSDLLDQLNGLNAPKLRRLLVEYLNWQKIGLHWESNADQQCFLRVDHEHVLVYGNSGFSFNGFEAGG